MQCSLRRSLWKLTLKKLSTRTYCFDGKKPLFNCKIHQFSFVLITNTSLLVLIERLHIDLNVCKNTTLLLNQPTSLLKTLYFLRKIRVLDGDVKTKCSSVKDVFVVFLVPCNCLPLLRIAYRYLIYFVFETGERKRVFLSQSINRVVCQIKTIFRPLDMYKPFREKQNVL
ncbi:hypothetical protein BY458DRAFT_488107 [Sporodiniella umbellata]|nr:hypothetical protein BY458DRAFT_488107 [Sporodiniella umbellata]